MNPIEVMEQTRKKKGITKTHIAKHCGRSVSWYADIAKGRRRVYLEDFMMIADAMGENVTNFFRQELSVTRNNKETA